MPLRFDVVSGRFIEIDEKKDSSPIAEMAKAVGGLIKGDKGDPGSRIHSGEGPPPADLGLDGDFYIDSLTMFFYGPKNILWGSGVCLLGKDGQPGKNGADGRDGKDGRDGVAGKDGINGINGKDGAPGRDGVSAPNIELQSTATHVQFRYGLGEWKNLFEIPKNKTIVGSGGGKTMANIQAAINSSLSIFMVNLTSGVTGVLSQANGGTGTTSNYDALHNVIYNMGYNPLPTDYYAVNFPVYDDSHVSGLVTVNLGDFYTATVQEGGIANGRPIYNSYVSVGNSGVAETSLFSDAIAQYQLVSDGYKLWIKDCGTFKANANNKRIRRYIGTTVILDTGSLAFNGGDWTVETQIIRTGVTTARVQCNWMCSNSLLYTLPQVTEVTGLNWQLGTTTSKITGQGGASDDITGISSTTQIIGAAY